jgi:hypothetical protein
MAGLEGMQRHYVYFLGRGGGAQEAILLRLSDLEYCLVFQPR